MMNVKLHISFIRTLGTGELTASRSGRFSPSPLPPRKEPTHPWTGGWMGRRVCVKAVLKRIPATAIYTSIIPVVQLIAVNVLS
jgi:hypothetical protein